MTEDVTLAVGGIAPEFEAFLSASILVIIPLVAPHRPVISGITSGGFRTVHGKLLESRQTQQNHIKISSQNMNFLSI